MKKIISTLMISGICLSTAVLPVYAQETLNKDNTNIEHVDSLSATYDSSSVDWESIDYISVFYLDGSIREDPFLKEAQDRGISIILEPTAHIEMRSSAFTHFNSISWISRSEGISLSVMPKKPYSISKEAAWQEIYKFIQYHPKFTEIKNETKLMSTYNQFVCHADFARGFKTSWNLEPWKKDKGYWGFVGNACN